MMSEWNEVRLGDLCTFVSRGITPQYVDEGIPVINQKCIRNNKVDLSLCRFTNSLQRIKEDKFVQYGDILINSTGTGTLGRVATYKHHLDKVSADGHVTIIHTKHDVDPLYLGYYLHSVEPLIENLGRGTTNQLELSPSDLKRIKIVLPCLQTQKQVVKILSAYDDLIENNNRRIALLEKAAQELYKEWFVRFRFPGYETTKFENGLPYGWEFKKLSQISDFVYGKMPKADLISGTGYPIFSGYRVSGYYPEYMYEDRQLVLIARGVGGTGDVKISPPKSYITNLSIVFLLKNNVYQQYLYHTYSLKNLRYLDTGAAQSQITIENLKRVKVICPEVTILEKFNGFVLDIERQIQKLLDKNQNLAKQRDLLLPRLLSGKLEV